MASPRPSCATTDGRDVRIEVYEAVVGDRPDLATRFVLMSGDVLDPALEAFAATHEMTRLAKPSTSLRSTGRCAA